MTFSGRSSVAVAGACALWCQGGERAVAQQVSGPDQEIAGTETGAGAQAEVESDPPQDRHHPLFPLLADRARERGYRVQRAFGFSGMVIHNVQNMDSRNLAVALAKGSDPPADGPLVPIPFVTTDQLESHTTNSQFKGDVWIFPFLNAFVGVGKVKGHIDIGVDIDLDAFIPPPICRPANPCGSVKLPFEAEVDNTTMTLGAILAYGSNDWAAIATVAKTLSVSSKERSDLETIDASLRLGPRLRIGKSMVLMPYAGADYFKLDATVSGIVRSGPVFPDGDGIGLRYQADLSTENPWAVINGVNLEFSPHFSIQAEYNWNANSNRFILSATFRP